MFVELGMRNMATNQHVLYPELVRQFMATVQVYYTCERAKIASEGSLTFVGVKIGHDGIDVRKSSEKPNLGQNFKSREIEQPKRIARRTRPRHEPARPASTAALPVESPVSSAVTRVSSPGEHDCVAGRLAGELGRDTGQVAGRARPCCLSARRRARSCPGSARPASMANSPWTIPNPVPSHNHASSSEVFVTQSSVEQVTVNLTPTASAMRRTRVPLEEPCL
ncbi:hypothetical protein F2Q69_00042311 [Brassica cretica]|uniref:Uncharacterized protein n=1 Tax=Brassica cretica TaxID=69181 RepID=A0A8S9NGR5_BRACR|nr:hypothetical protein F2Q69_00042311 [Brassica cretica]